jgi:lipoprotein NlpI
MRINAGCVLNLLFLTHLLTSAAVADEAVARVQNAAGNAKDVKAAEAADAEILAMNKELTADLEGQLKTLPAILDTDADAVGKYSRRGDLHMFLGKFAEAESDYKKMSMLKPDLDASHWRLGIAMYLAGHPEDAAAQFDKYHSFDNVDRENGIWRYLSHRAAFGKEKAREQLLKYEKDDRPPFREVYQLFEGTMTADQVLQSISPDLPESSRQSRLFYAQLYVGLNDAVEDKSESALQALREAVKNAWPRDAGFGPDYMWHVGRLEYLRLKAPAKDTDVKL